MEYNRNTKFIILTNKNIFLQHIPVIWTFLYLATSAVKDLTLSQPSGCTTLI